MPIGKLEPFDLSSKQWPAYIRRVKQYILLNEVKDELQVPLLITIVGEATYTLMCDLCSPAHPESKGFDELVKLVSEHLEPKRSEIAERHVFRLRRQRPGESLTEYLHNLKHLATTCNFGTMLEENLRDQFVSGLANELMRSRIFAEKDIKYKEAVELALALEAAEKHAEVSGSTMTSTSTSSARAPLSGRQQFILRTDHQPLSFIFGKKCGIPQTAASRLQRWAARLSAYDFTVEFVRSSDNGPADALSRLPLPCRRATPSECVSYVQLIEENLPISFKDVSKETKKDPLLSKIVGFVMFGWPSSVAGGEEEKAYFARRNEIVLELGCLIYKYRIIVPPSLRKGVLKEIHEGHLGINKMKNVSRSYVYWPSLDRDIEDLCRKCEACRIVRDSPPRAILHPWEYPLCPWQRVHADFAECAGKKYLIVLDAHSKWVEVISMTRTDAESTILAFQTLFARFGQPAQLVTDNGPPFSALDFKNFCANNGIKSVTTAPYRPQGNGAAENMVKTVKKVIKRALFVKENVSAALNKFLFQYRNCEHATTGVSPAVLMLGRRLRGRLDALRPDVSLVVRSAQERQINQKGGMPRQVGIGDTVMARDYSSKGNKWTEGVVVSQTGPVSYKVDMGKGVEWRRHRDQVIKVNKKNRYSLARTSTLGQEAEQTGENDDERVAVDSDADVTFEDAVGSPGGEGATQAPEDVHSPTPPPPGASARALRAYHRKKKV
ncbi:uncharacterized protein K02A2.6-like [Maniola jurtina]|uniref:uncharacterized protein K02A2.6-like n=1 Tax=Maniola jurtina TaxID=191418 RepID=UPI001E68C9D0|nr:uncharacterized protein K02A2.6-like [Maniola jurtina]